MTLLFAIQTAKSDNDCAFIPINSGNNVIYEKQLNELAGITAATNRKVEFSIIINADAKKLVVKNNTNSKIESVRYDYSFFF